MVRLQDHVCIITGGAHGLGRAYARRFGEDPDLWGATGLIHDFDYEKHPTPEEHPRFGCAILRKRGYPDAMI